MEILNKLDFVDYDKTPNIKKLSADEITILDVNEIWDGPLDGICQWKCTDYYFYSIDQLREYILGERFPNIFILIKLDSTQIKIIKNVKKIYSDWNLNLISTNKLHELKSNNKPQIVKTEQVIGWFEAIESEKNTSKFIDSYFKWKGLINSKNCI